MTSWLQDLLRAHPEIAFFLVLGIGYLIGRIAIGGFKIGAVTGTLLAGVIVGQLGVTMSDQVKQCFFLLFLFAIGFRTGPQFFRGLRSDGLGHAALAAIVAIAGLFVAYGISLLFDYDAGTAAGLVAGALTESATIGTAMDAISKLPVAEAERNALENNIPVAFSVTYMLGVAVAAWVLSQLGPRLMRVDLAEECRKLERGDAGGQAGLPCRCGVSSSCVRTPIDPGSPWVGRRVGALEGAAGGDRIAVDRVRSGGLVHEGDPALQLRAGDVVAVAGRRNTLVEVLERPGSGLREVDDKELLDMPGDVVDVVVTNAAIDGRTLGELGAEQAARGVFLKAHHARRRAAWHTAGHEGPAWRRADDRRFGR